MKCQFILAFFVNLISVFSIIFKTAKLKEHLFTGTFAVKK